MRNARPDVSDKELTAELANGNDDKCKPWMVVVRCYEAKKNGLSLDTAEGYVPPSNVGDKEATITSEATDHMVFQAHVAIFWPQADFEPNFGRKAAPVELEWGEDISHVAGFLVCFGV